MNDRVNEELLAEAAGRHAAYVAAKAGGALITAEYDGQAFLFRADGWFNATLVAKKYNKRPVDWLNLGETREYLAALKELDSNCEPESLLETRRGRHNSGTWMHPKLAVPFARWINIRFSVWCDDQIGRILARKLSASQPQRVSTFKERRPLYDSAVDIVESTGMLFGEAYRVINAVAGTHHMDEITVEMLEMTIPPVQRLGSGTATPQDYARVDKGMVEIYGVSAQLLLGFDSTEAAGGK